MTRRTTTLRVFLGVPIPAELRDRLSALQEELRPRLPATRWVEPESIHLTLQFLGPILPSQTSEILAVVDPIVGRRKPFVCGVRGLGAFPNTRTAKVLWIGVDARGTELGELVVDLENALAPLGFAGEGRPFRPHLTLARSRGDGEALAAILADRDVVDACHDAGRLPIEVVHLYRSDPGAGGPRYTPLTSLPLGGGSESSRSHGR